MIEKTLFNATGVELHVKISYMEKYTHTHRKIRLWDYLQRIGKAKLKSKTLINHESI